MYPRPSYRLAVAARLVAAGLSFGCADSPERAFAAYVEAAVSGDREGMLQQLTHDARVVVRGLLAASPKAVPFLAPDAASGGLAPVRVVGSDVYRTAEGERATLEVVAQDGSKLPVAMVREDGAWRIDLFDCERRWSRLRLERELDSPSKLR